MSQTKPPARNAQELGASKQQRSPWLGGLLALLALVLLGYLLLQSRGPTNGKSENAVAGTGLETATRQDASAFASPPKQELGAASSPLSAPSSVRQSPLVTNVASVTVPLQASAAVSAETSDGIRHDQNAADAPASPPAQLPRYTYEVVNTYPHDANAFTQGLVFDGETLYEGTGLNGRSSLREVDLESGSVLRQVDLPQQYFGEGITVWDDQIVQLTWQSGQGFVYDKESFELQGSFNYATEGWGITEDGRRLIMSDGTATLYFWNPENFQPVDEIDVYDLDGPVYRLNELEYVKGEILANVWQTDLIAQIDPVTGQVLGWIDLTGLLAPADRAGADVLNGIAYQEASDRLFVTGKLWPKLFEIRLIPLAQ